MKLIISHQVIRQSLKSLKDVFYLYDNALGFFRYMSIDVLKLYLEKI